MKLKLPNPETYPYDSYKVRVPIVHEQPLTPIDEHIGHLDFPARLFREQMYLKVYDYEGRAGWIPEEECS